MALGVPTRVFVAVAVAVAVRVAAAVIVGVLVAVADAVAVEVAVAVAAKVGVGIGSRLFSMMVCDPVKLVPFRTNFVLKEYTAGANLRAFSVRTEYVLVTRNC